MTDPSMKWVKKMFGEIGGNGGSGVLKLIKLNENWAVHKYYKQMKGLGKLATRWFDCPQSAPNTAALLKHVTPLQGRKPNSPTVQPPPQIPHRSLQHQPSDPTFTLLCHPSNFCPNSAPPSATRTRSTVLRSLNGTAPPPPPPRKPPPLSYEEQWTQHWPPTQTHLHYKTVTTTIQSPNHSHTPPPLWTPRHHIPPPLWHPRAPASSPPRPTLELRHPSKWPLQVNKCPGYDVKLIRCVLGMTINSSVVVQGMTVKLRPCLRFRACGWGCVRWRAPCRKGVWS